MERARESNKIWIRYAVIILIGITAVLFFLYSVHGMLYTEAKTKLLEVTKQAKEQLDSGKTEVSTEAFFKDPVLFCVIDDAGHVTASYGEDAKKFAEANENYIGQFLENETAIQYRSEVEKSKGLVEKSKMISKDIVYIAVVTAPKENTGYLIGMVSASAVDADIRNIWNIAVLVVILAMLGLLFAIGYNLYARRRNMRAAVRANRPDPVTGLSHFLIHKTVAETLIRNAKQPYCYVYFTIDKFNLIGELSGQEYCRYLLKEVADSIQSQLKDGELLTRYQEDCFGALMFFDDELGFRQRLMKLLKHAGEAGKTENNFCNITFRSGVYVIGRQHDLGRIIERAKKARNQNRAGSVANIAFYQKDKEVNKESDEEYQEAVEAIEKKEFLIYLQPKYRLDAEKISGAEALVRWNHPKKGILAPSVFLPLLEEKDQITALDYYVTDQVCACLKEWKDKNRTLVPVSVNLSVKQFDDRLFVQKLIEIVDHYEIAHELIEFEFPESAIYEQQQALKDAMKVLDREGFLVSIDNFGIGYSAVHLLKELPLHMIKIDRGLIRDLDDSEFANKDSAVVTHIISLAKSMNVEVAAEGVETKEQRDLLKKHDCDVIQGFYYQRPMPPNDFERLLIS